MRKSSQLHLWEAEVDALFLRDEDEDDARQQIEVLEGGGQAEDMSEIMTKTVTEPPNGVPANLNAAAKALEIDVATLVAQKEAAGPASGYKFRPITSAEFAATQYKLEWHVKRLIVANQPLIIGGPKKSMKTSLLVDLCLSLGAGVPFLGQFEVRKPVRCCLISGESGGATLQETALRICRTKKINLADVDCFWDERLPQLSVQDELVELSKGLAQRQIMVVVIDPMYLCLLSGDNSKNAGNMFTMGPIFSQVARACLSVGCMPVLATHARKNLTNPWAPIELEDLAFSGVQEFARQWLLIGRREKYKPGTGLHKLWLEAGGSVGHGGLWGVDIDEGQLEENFTGRRWSVNVLSLGDLELEKKSERLEKDHVKQTEEEAKLLVILDETIKEPISKTQVKTRLGWRDEKFRLVVANLIQDGAIEEAEGQVTVGKGAIRKVIILKRKPEKDHR